ncbi:MAG: hypothetical protein R3257_05680 [bacterium]|nr:hypothetical protein [bacterium]
MFGSRVNRPGNLNLMENNGGDGDNPGGRQPRATRPETPRARSKSSNPPPPEDREAKGTPALPVPSAPPAARGVGRRFEKLTLTVDAGRGYQMVEKALDTMDPQDLARLRKIAEQRPDQPWVMAGVSDGMGFQSTVALLASGMIRHGVGIFYEPPTLLKLGSEVHQARLARVEGLRIMVDKLGVDFPIFYEDVVLPRWGHPEGPKPFPAAVMEGIEASQQKAAIPDINFVNSIAFARWISPSPGVEQRTGIPSVDLEGRVILMDMKPYREKQYEGTLDSMGRNHGVLLEALKERFGPQSLSLFYTWAGGSQNFRILHGVYGGSSLGHAKEIGETDTVKFHLMSMAEQMSYGAHKVVRFPDFISHALFGIPGGGAFGLIAHHVLRNRSAYQGVPQLAARAFIEAFDGTHNLRNPLAQIELDNQETAFMKDGIEPLLDQFYRNVARYRKEHPEWEGKALDLETSRKLLGGLAAKDYLDHLPKAWD